MTKEEVLAAIKKYRTKEEAAASLGISRFALYRFLQSPNLNQKGSANKKLGLADFKERHSQGSVAERVKSALNKLGDGWDYEIGFSRLAGVTRIELADVAEQFQDHIVYIKKPKTRVWAGNTSIAKQMREMV